MLSHPGRVSPRVVHLTPQLFQQLHASSHWTGFLTNRPRSEWTIPVAIAACWACSALTVSDTTHEFLNTLPSDRVEQPVPIPVRSRHPARRTAQNGWIPVEFWAHALGSGGGEELLLELPMAPAGERQATKDATQKTAVPLGPSVVSLCPGAIVNRGLTGCTRLYHGLPGRLYLAGARFDPVERALELPTARAELGSPRPVAAAYRRKLVQQLADGCDAVAVSLPCQPASVEQLNDCICRATVEQLGQLSDCISSCVLLHKQPVWRQEAAWLSELEHVVAPRVRARVKTIHNLQ